MVSKSKQNFRCNLFVVLLSLNQSSAKIGDNETITKGRHLRSIEFKVPPTYNSSDGACGYGNFNNGICPNSTMCCTPTGWCVSEKTYCATANRNATHLACGYGNVGNGSCVVSASDSGVCCSIYGWCGMGSDYCNNPFTPPPTVSPSPSPPLDASDVTSAPTSPPIPFVDGTYYFGETYYLYPDPTPVPKRSCGNGTVGDGICPDPDLTCFEDGYCRKKKW